MASTFGGMFSACALLFTAPLLSKVALNFGVVEMFALGVFGLSIVTAVSSHSIIKGLLGAVLGLLLGTVGRMRRLLRSASPLVRLISLAACSSLRFSSACSPSPSAL